MNALSEAAIETTARYLEHKGCEIVDRSWECPEGIGSIDLVAEDHGELVFVDVKALATTDGFPEAHGNRGHREVLAAKWLVERGEDYGNIRIRFDDVDMMVSGSGNAMMRHHVDRLGTMEPAE